MAAALVVAVCGAAAGQEEHNPRYVPDETRVVLLPVANVSGEKDAKQRSLQAENGKRELVKRFAERGFRLAEPRTIRRALDDLHADLSGEERLRREELERVGRALEADLAVYVEITDVSQQLNQNLFSKTREGKAKIRMWILDVARGAPLLNGVVLEGSSTGGHFGELEKGSRRIVLAVANGIRHLLEPILKPYPVVERAHRERAGD